MSLRVRKDGRVLCAAIHDEAEGDTYIPDGLSYQMTTEYKVLVSEPIEKHRISGQWFWANNVPEGVELSEFYLTH